MNEDTNFASRKFILTCLMLLSTLALFLLGYIDSATWADVSKWVMGIYCAANAATWATDVLKR